jgi:hypothetical protein
MSRAALLVALAGSAWTQTARAADARPPYPPHADQSKSSPAQPGPRRKELLATASLGPGFFSSRSGASLDTRRYVGTTLSFGLNVGGHLGRNFAFGAAYLRDQVYGLGVKDSLATVQSPNVKDLSFDLNLFGLFGDVILPFAGPELHFQGVFGYATLGVSGRSNADGVSTPDGTAFSAAISGQLPLLGPTIIGLTARVTYAPLSVTEKDGTAVHIVVPALLLTVGYD